MPVYTFGYVSVRESTGEVAQGLGRVRAACLDEAREKASRVAARFCPSYEGWVVPRLVVTGDNLPVIDDPDETTVWCAVPVPPPGEDLSRKYEHLVRDRAWEVG